MSYDPAGIYNLPPAYKAEPGTTIRSEQHNAPLEDIAQALSSVLVRDGRGGMVGPLDMGNFKITNVAPGTNPSDAATVSQLVPIGTVVDYAGSTAPTGWLFCAGQAVSRSTYAALFSVIGTRYGDGNGSTTFNLPDLRGRVVAGRDNMGGTSANRLTNKPGGIKGDVLGAAGGSETHQMTIDEMPRHNHGGFTSSNSHSHTYSGVEFHDRTNAGSETERGVLPLTRNTSTYTHNHAIPNQGNNVAHNNVQPTIILNKIIKATN